MERSSGVENRNLMWGKREDFGNDIITQKYHHIFVRFMLEIPLPSIFSFELREVIREEGFVI